MTRLTDTLPVFLRKSVTLVAEKKLDPSRDSASVAVENVRVNRNA